MYQGKVEQTAIEKVAQAPVNRRAVIAAAAAGAIAAMLAPMGAAEKALAENAASGNLQVSIPSRIDYVTRADGTLITPSPSALRIVNEGDEEVRVKAIKATPANGWNLVDDASTSELDNAAEIQMGVEGDIQNLTTYAGEGGAEVGDETAWMMSTQEENENLSELQLYTMGEVANVDGGALRSGEGGGEAIAQTEWQIANDTITNEVLARISQLESDLAAARQALANVNAAITTVDGHPRAVFVDPDLTQDLPYLPALVVDTSDMSLWLAQADSNSGGSGGSGGGE